MQADLNVTLTAISQLWNAADFLAHARPARQTAAIDRLRISELGSTVLDADKYVELLELLLSSLQVRNTHDIALDMCAPRQCQLLSYLCSC